MAMREILFRGKRIATGHWVEGSLLDYGDGEFDICSPSGAPDELLKYCVYPESIGQYTGQTDRNGVKIFEGDMVVSFDLYSGEEHCGIVSWDYLLSHWKIGNSGSLYGSPIASYEVIGNIHDNPELPAEADP